jgi:Putative beta barrel porin-7 (BBP7)
MRFRVTCSMLFVAIFTGAAPAQSQPSPLWRPPSPAQESVTIQGKETPTDVVVVNPSTDCDAGQFSLFSVRPDGFRPFAYVSADFGLSAMSRSVVPALVTSSPGGIPQASAGVLGVFSTNLLLGDSYLNSLTSTGGRLTTGINLVQGLTFEFSGFFIQNGPSSFDAGSNGSDNIAIARPFFEPFTGQQAAELVAFPNRFAGNIDVRLRTSVWGVEGTIYEDWNCGIPIIPGFGFRYANLNDNLQIQQNTTALNAPALTFNGANIPLSDSTRVTDTYQTRNQFIGPQFCLKYEETLGSFTLGLTGKVALGTTTQTVTIAGQSEHLSASGQTIASANGGFLATASNIGSYNQNNFSAIPEFEVKLSHKLTANLSLFASYDFMCWTGVGRAGSQITPTVNLTQVPTAAIFSPGFGGPSNPGPTFRNSDLVVNSLRVGIEFKY